jgi:hypothetical protein
VACIRRAWLELGGAVIPLDDEVAGYYCDELDLGYPEVRDVMDDRPDQDGVDDRTALSGSRAITANIKTLAAGAATPDEISTLFGPLMLPALRPRLHYVLERPGNPERVVTVRAANYGAPLSGKSAREVQLSWVASDPWMFDPAGHSATAYAGTGGVASGRHYPLVHPRTYPAGGGAPTTGVISSAGDVPIRPLVRIYGPITTPEVLFQVSNPDPIPNGAKSLVFVAGFRIDAGRWVDVDSKKPDIIDDTGASVMSSVDWSLSTWPVLPVSPAVTYMTLAGSSTSPITQALASWNDGYIT